jgi:hypothetical protein
LGFLSRQTPIKLVEISIKKRVVLKMHLNRLTRTKFQRQMSRHLDSLTDNVLVRRISNSAIFIVRVQRERKQGTEIKQRDK